MPIYKIEQDGRVYTVEAESEQGAFEFMDQEVGPVSEGPNSSAVWPALAAGGLLAGGLALRNPALIKQGGAKAFNTLQAARHWGALSGLAVPKSTIGNVGASLTASAERRSLAPLKEFFSRQTAKDWLREIRDPEATIGWAENADETHAWNPFAKLMSAGDVATRKALVRAGLTDADAARLTLQSTLPELGITGKSLDALESRLGRFAMLYRRTPLNSAVHGVTSSLKHPELGFGAAGTGFAQGSMEGPIGDPMSIAMTAPIASVYNVPYMVGAGIGKFVSGGTKTDAANAMRGISPVPEDMGSAFLEPWRPVTKPAAFSAVERLRNLFRTGESY